ncbi:MAG: hypothetical protein ABI687_03050 [Flavitalea sp.]
MCQEDLNQEWDDNFTDTAHAPTEPEVACVKEWIRKWLREGNKIDLGLDVHSQGQEGSANYLHTPTDILGNFTKSLNKFWPVEYVPMDFPGSANHCLASGFKIPTGTFEIPQSNVNVGKYLTIDDYQSYGKGTALAIYNYFTSVISIINAIFANYVTNSFAIIDKKIHEKAALPAPFYNKF